MCPFPYLVLGTGVTVLKLVFGESFFFKTPCQDGGVLKAVSNVERYYKESRGPCHSDIDERKKKEKSQGRINSQGHIVFISALHFSNMG